MEVILLQDVRNLGRLGQVRRVKDGYARNFLIPNDIALYADDNSKAIYETRRSELEANAKKVKEEAEVRAKTIQEKVTVLEMTAPIIEGDQIYGSVGVTDFLSALKESDVDVVRSEVILPEGPIKRLGEHKIFLQLHADVTVEINVNVSAEEG